MKQRSGYSLGGNLAFMISLAWRERRSVICFALAMTFSEILLGLTQLFMTPSVLGAVEDKASAGELAVVILLFTGALILFRAAGAYLDRKSVV